MRARRIHLGRLYCSVRSKKGGEQVQSRIRMQGVVMVGDRLAGWYLGANGVSDGTARAPSRIPAATGIELAGDVFPSSNLTFDYDPKSTYNVHLRRIKRCQKTTPQAFKALVRKSRVHQTSTSRRHAVQVGTPRNLASLLVFFMGNWRVQYLSKFLHSTQA